MTSENTILTTIKDLPELSHGAHFEVVAYKVKNKIFFTHNQPENRICVKLSEIDQDVFSKAFKGVIFPVDNKWGKHGWTLVDLKSVDQEVLKDIILTAYCHVAPKKLALPIAKSMGLEI